MNKLQILFLLLLIHGNIFAGWVITEQSTDPYGNRFLQTVFIQDNLIRYETPSSIAIIDLNNNFITIVFSQYRVFWSGTISELKTSSLESYERQIEEIIAALHPSEREALASIYLKFKQQLMDTIVAQPTNKFVLVETDINDEILGYNATKYNIISDSTLVESVWYTEEIQPYSDIDIHNMNSFMQQLSPGSGRSKLTQTSEYYNLLKNGMLLKSVEYSPEGNTYEVVVTNIRDISIVPEFFLPPDNYHKAELSEILNLMPEIKDYDDLDR